MTTATRTYRQFNRVARRGLSEEMRENMRAIGFFFLILASLAMAFDVANVMAGRGAAGFSGINEIWAYIDRTSFDIIQQLVLVKFGTETWQYVLNPVMSLPAALLFGLPGMFMLRRYAPDIKVRVPTTTEIEMMRMGIDPRRGQRRKY